MHVPWEAVGVSCAALAFLAAAGRRAIGGARTADRLAMLLLGDAKTNQPSLSDRLDEITRAQRDTEQWQAAMSHRIVTVETRTQELAPNGGSTVKDKVDRVLTQVADLRRDVVDHHDQQIRHEALSDAADSAGRAQLNAMENALSTHTTAPHTHDGPAEPA